MKLDVLTLESQCENTPTDMALFRTLRGWVSAAYDQDTGKIPMVKQSMYRNMKAVAAAAQA